MASSSPFRTLNRRDLDFQLFEVLHAERLAERTPYGEHDFASMVAVLDAAQSLAEREYQTHYRTSDAHEPVLVDGAVRLPEEVGKALRAFTEAGFLNADRPLKEGGQALPFTLFQACLACFQAANIATSSYSFLTIAGAAVIRTFGTEAQRQDYADPMMEGRYFGTMCLSEPHAGSSLADIRTRATLRPDGRYALSGTKMWISGGEHELSDNIVHLVLARIEGGPPGTRGISLFIVPRYRVADGGAGKVGNDVALVGLNHKMGYRGTVNTVLSFGEHGDCIGELVGDPHRGLGYMFHMMNEARISVGVGATMLGGAGYLCSLDYANQRLQGRAPGYKDPTAPPVALSEHADIRRMLVTQKAYVEGALALCLYGAMLVDDQRTAATEAERRRAATLLDILTPIIKSWPSEFCLEANRLAMQVLGGYGYTRDFPVEQYYRDNRLNLIHEGTHGIQAQDLVGRKIRMQDGTAFQLLLAAMRDDVAANRDHAELHEFTGALRDALDQVERATASMARSASDERAYMANATLYLDMLGHVVIAWMWLRQAAVAVAGGDAAASDADRRFYEGKLSACCYFYRYELTRLAHWLPILASADPLFVSVDPRSL